MRKSAVAIGAAEYSRVGLSLDFSFLLGQFGSTAGEVRAQTAGVDGAYGAVAAG